MRLKVPAPTDAPASEPWPEFALVNRGTSLVHVFLYWVALSFAGLGCATSLSGTQPNAGVQSSSGTPAADFTLRDLKGEMMRLSDFRGKVVLLSFFGSTCEPCVAELLQFQTIWDRHREKGFELISVNVDGPELKSVVQQMVGRNGFRFPVLLDQETEVISRYNPKLEMPYSVLIDRQGKIVRIHLGYRAGDEAKVEQEVLALLGS